MHSNTQDHKAGRIKRSMTVRTGQLVKPSLGLLATLVCMACSAQATSSSLTLEDALRISAVEHPSVKARRSEKNAANARLDVAERQQYPNLSFQSTGDSFGGRSNTVRIEQPLWMGGRIKAGIDSANASIQQADAGVIQAQVDIMLKVVASFTELGRIQARQVAARSNVQEHARLAQMIQRRVESEISPSSDSTLATARFSQARAELNQLDSLAIRARSTLGQAVGKPVDDIVLPVQRDLSPYSLDRMIQAALDYSPSIRRLDAETEAARAEIDARRSDALPQVKLRLDRTNGRATSNTQVYIALDVQTGAGMSVQASVREAEARKDALQSQIEAVRRETVDSVSADWADLNSFASQARDLQRQVESTTSVFDSFVRQYAIGRKGWNDVLNAQREVAQARFQLADATWGELRASMRLHLFTGLVTGEYVALSGPTPLDHPIGAFNAVPKSEASQATAAAPVAPVSAMQSLWHRIRGDGASAPVDTPAAPSATETQASDKTESKAEDTAKIKAEPTAEIKPETAESTPQVKTENTTETKAAPTAEVKVEIPAKSDAESTTEIKDKPELAQPVAAANAWFGSDTRTPVTFNAPDISVWALITLPTLHLQIGATASPVEYVVVAASPIEPAQAQREDSQVTSVTPEQAPPSQ